MSAGDITALEARIRRDIEMTAHPRTDWMEPRLYQGRPALDARIGGAGQSGVAIAFALIRDRVRNILVIDRAPEGREGIWVGFARMPTLRSPKDQTGPDLGIPSLTFEAWHDAVYGAGSFAGLGLIPTGAWHDYLQWYRRVLALPVRNGVAATAIAPAALDDGGRCLLVTLSTGEVLAARKLVLATGQDGTGQWGMPDFGRPLPAGRRAHTFEVIHFVPLPGAAGAVPRGRAERRPRHPPGRAAGPRAGVVRRQDRAVVPSLYAAAGRGGSAARGLSLSRSGLRLPRTQRRRGAVAGRHPSVRHRLDPELRAVGQQQQCHDGGRAPRGGGPDPRTRSPRPAAALARARGPHAPSSWDGPA